MSPITCPKCSSILKQDHKFCINCGCNIAEYIRNLPKKKKISKSLDYNPYKKNFVSKPNLVEQNQELEKNIENKIDLETTPNPKIPSNNTNLNDLITNKRICPCCKNWIDEKTSFCCFCGQNLYIADLKKEKHFFEKIVDFIKTK